MNVNLQDANKSKRHEKKIHRHQDSIIGPFVAPVCVCVVLMLAFTVVQNTRSFYFRYASEC